MTDQTPISNRTFEYFEQYRAKVNKIKETKDLMRKIKDDAQAEITRLYTNVQDMEKECLVMRRIITKVIEEGLDDVEARLRGDNVIETNMWQGEHKVGGDIDPNMLHRGTHYMLDANNSILNDLTVGATGATGAYGALGATGPLGGNPYSITTFPHTGYAGILNPGQLTTTLVPTNNTTYQATVTYDPVTGKYTSI